MKITTPYKAGAWRVKYTEFVTPNGIVKETLLGGCYADFLNQFLCIVRAL